MGEYTGLRVIKEYYKNIGQSHRNVCLIPVSAHGTNPASAAMNGLDVVVVNSDANGNIDMQDLIKKAEKHKDNLACVMITYPSTFGVFELGMLFHKRFFFFSSFFFNSMSFSSQRCQGCLRAHPQAWWPGLPRWCQHERPGRSLPPW